jgi:DNA-binding transcriptional LysR family regulator
MLQLDWNLARAFAATADTGSLSAGARRLGLTQPTLSRQVAALEAELGLTLFSRVGKKLLLTEAGRKLLAPARAMTDAAETLRLAALGEAQTVGGHVSITASDGLAAWLLPDIVARIRREEPEITIEVISTNALSDLRRHEADIAIRHVRPAEPELVGRLVREMPARFYASADFVKANGLPQTVDDLSRLELIGFAPLDRLLAFLADRGIMPEPACFHVISENGVVTWEMVRRGLGIGIMIEPVARRTPGMVCVLPDLAVMQVPVWLVSRQDLRTSHRVRRVANILAEELSRA